MSETESKSKEYNRKKFEFSIYSLFFTVILYMTIYFAGISRAISIFSFAVSTNYFLALTLYLFIFSLLEAVISFPLSFYGSYMLEHKYGQSNETKGAFLLDDIKGFFVKLILYTILFNIIYGLILISPENWWFYATIVSIGLVVILTKLVPVLLIPLFYKLEPITDEELLSRLRALCMKSNIKLIGIFSINLSKKTKAGNAGFAGIGSTKRIMISDNILASYTYDEIETIIAHEIGHYIHKDLIKGIFLQAILFLFSFFIIHLTMTKLVSLIGLQGLSDFSGFPIFLIISLIISLIVLPIINTITRQLEYAADKTAFELADHKCAFISALTKLTEQNLGEFEPNPIKEFIFYNHPSTKKRVERIRNY